MADKFIKVIFVKSENNTSDIFTKNVQSDVLKKHDKEFVWKVEILSEQIHCSTGRVLENVACESVTVD